MLQKGALEVVDQPGPGIYSCFFFGEGDGDWRPVLDLSALNGFMTTKFRMETVGSTTQKGNWMFSIDLKDAFVQVPIHPDSHLYLRFVLESRVYQFHALCLGLSTAPQVFIRVFTLILEWVHRRGVRCLRYLNDWLVVAESLHLLQHCDLVL